MYVRVYVSVCSFASLAGGRFYHQPKRCTSLCSLIPRSLESFSVSRHGFGVRHRTLFGGWGCDLYRTYVSPARRTSPSTFRLLAPVWTWECPSEVWVLRQGRLGVPSSHTQENWKDFVPVNLLGLGGFSAGGCRGFTVSDFITKRKPENERKNPSLGFFKV